MTLFDLPPGPSFGPWLRMTRTAVLSDDGRYRYSLTRRWDTDLPWLGWVMLNPSTADHDMDDPTIRRIVDFTWRWGYGGAIVCNLFGWRATDPSDLVAAADPIGPGNAPAVRNLLADLDVVCAWGASVPREHHHRPQLMRQCLRVIGARPSHLGLTKDGHPRHPLYLAATTERQPWVA